ncbi:MAG: antitoxin HicB [Propionicimonas sp.]
MNTITVTARRWEHGWELEIDPDHHTQVTTLDKAAGQVIDYLDTVDPDTDHSDWQIGVIPQIGELGVEVTLARQATETAAAASRAAAKRSREAARRLRDAGYSVTDSAVILGVSRGRVSQLVNG